MVSHIDEMLKERTAMFILYVEKEGEVVVTLTEEVSVDKSHGAKTFQVQKRKNGPEKLGDAKDDRPCVLS